MSSMVQKGGAGISAALVIDLLALKSTSCAVDIDSWLLTVVTGL